MSFPRNTRRTTVSSTREECLPSLSPSPLIYSPQDGPDQYVCLVFNTIVVFSLLMLSTIVKQRCNSTVSSHKRVLADRSFIVGYRASITVIKATNLPSPRHSAQPPQAYVTVRLSDDSSLIRTSIAPRGVAPQWNVKIAPFVQCFRLHLLW